MPHRSSGTKALLPSGNPDLVPCERGSSLADKTYAGMTPGAMKYTKANPAQAASITIKPCCSVISSTPKVKMLGTNSLGLVAALCELARVLRPHSAQ